MRSFSVHCIFIVTTCPWFLAGIEALSLEISLLFTYGQMHNPITHIPHSNSYKKPKDIMFNKK